MSLVKCNKCGKEISNRSDDCIHCGWPIGVAFDNSEIDIIPNAFNNSNDKLKHKTQNDENNIGKPIKYIGIMGFVVIVLLLIIIIFVLVLKIYEQKTIIENNATAIEVQSEKDDYSELGEEQVANVIQHNKSIDDGEKERNTLIPDDIEENTTWEDDEYKYGMISDVDNNGNQKEYTYRISKDHDDNNDATAKSNDNKEDSFTLESSKYNLDVKIFDDGLPDSLTYDAFFIEAYNKKANVLVINNSGGDRLIEVTTSFYDNDNNLIDVGTQACYAGEKCKDVVIFTTDTDYSKVEYQFVSKEPLFKIASKYMTTEYNISNGEVIGKVHNNSEFNVWDAKAHILLYKNNRMVNYYNVNIGNGTIPSGGDGVYKSIKGTVDFDKADVIISSLIDTTKK